MPHGIDHGKVQVLLNRFWADVDPTLNDAELFMLVTNLYVQTCYQMIDGYPVDMKIENRLVEATHSCAMLLVDRSRKRDGEAPMVHPLNSEAN